MERLANAKTSSTVLGYLQGIQFPAKKDDIVHAARESGAPNDIVDVLSGLPRNEFGSADELIELYPHMS